MGKKVEIEMSRESARAFVEFTRTLIPLGISVGDKLGELMLEFVVSTGVKRKWVLGADLLVEMKKKLGVEADRYWLEHMRSGRWVEDEHWLRQSPKKIYYDLDAVWGDCKGYGGLENGKGSVPRKKPLRNASMKPEISDTGFKVLKWGGEE